MILIADSGGTKTDWRLVSNNDIFSFSTEGLNPVYKSEQHIKGVINDVIKKNDINPKSINNINFYGAGCMEFEKAGVLEIVLNDLFSESTIKVDSDILAAARASCGHKEGIISIFGTGSNVCLYNGSKVTYTRSGLGYILGDEGSAAHLGKELIKAVLNEKLSSGFITNFYEHFNLTKPQIIDSLYCRNNTNLFLASFSEFIFNHKDKEEISKLIESCFFDFFQTHIKPIKDHKKYGLYLVGSVAFYYQDEIKKIAKNFSMEIGGVIKNPIDRLVEYHSKKSNL